MITLGQYKGLVVRPREIDVTEEEVNNCVARILEDGAEVRTVTDRPVAMGDKIILDFAGYQNGTPFAGGQAEDYELLIGSHSFIDTFEEQLVGAEVGKEVEVHVTFPVHYGSAELAGKPAMFRCVVKGIREKVVPELTDEFCKENFGCTNITIFRERVKNEMLANKERQMNEARTEALVMRVVADSEVDLPEEEVQSIMGEQLDSLRMNMMQQGMMLEDYLNMTGMTIEDLKNQIRPEAERQLKTHYVLLEIARAEEIAVTEEEERHNLIRMAMNYHTEVSVLEKQLDNKKRQLLREEMLRRKAMKVILENVVEQ